MSFVRVNNGDLELGKPVPWPLYDDKKQLLLARGVMLETDSQKKALLERGLFRKLPVSDSRAIPESGGQIGRAHV